MKEDLHLAVNSMSFTAPDISLVSSRWATNSMMQQARRFRDVYTEEGLFTPEHIALSAHLGDTINPKKLKNLAERTGIAISSIDMANGVPSLIAWTDRGKVLHALQTPEGRKKIKEEIGRIPNHLGWKRVNVGSEKKAFENLEQGMRLVPDAQPIIVRATMDYWNESSRGRELIDFLQNNPRVVLAIEPGQQSPEEYRTMLLNLAEENKDHIYADVDLGKVAKGQYYAHANETPNPLAFYESFLQEKATRSLLAVTTFDQYIPGDDETHKVFSEGPIDLSQAASLLGKAVQEYPQDFRFQPTILLEFHPSLYDQMLSPQEKNCMRRIVKAYKEDL